MAIAIAAAALLASGAAAQAPAGGGGEAALNASYANLRARLSPGFRARLVQAQRGWLAWRTAECTMRANGADGGSVAPAVIAQCQHTLARERASQLRALARCAECELACPR